MDKSPNIVIIMTDQQQARLRKSEGCPLDTMPNLDRLGREGVDFTKAYTPRPACAPARVSLFTGRYPSATAVRTNHNIPDATYKTDLVDLLKGKGYRVGLSGKNHSHLKADDFDLWYALSHGGGDEEGRTDEEIGFDRFLTDLRHMTCLEATPFPVETQGPYRAVSKAQEWIDGLDQDSPFFLWLSFAEPHNPYQVPAPYFDMFPPEELPPVMANHASLEGMGYKYRHTRAMWEQTDPDFEEHIPRTRSNYFGMLRLIDDQLGRFLQFLEDRGIKDDTIIIFTSDHGDFVGEYGLIRKGPELPEVLCRIPFVMTGPGIDIKGKEQSAHINLVDVMPTLCDAIGADIPDGVQGRSLWPLLQGKPVRNQFQSAYMEHGFGGAYHDDTDTLDPAEEGAFNNGCTFDELNSWTQAGTARALRKGKWKLIYDMEGTGQLYDLDNDPAELDNLWDHAESAVIRNELVEELMQWILKTSDPLPYPRRRYVFKRDR